MDFINTYYYFLSVFLLDIQVPKWATYVSL